jgi:predicted Zn finger-like uncharacterized protein
MLTTCPECRTTFRVAHDQLESRRGLVRCGYCRAVFNAYDTLLPEFEAPTRAEANEIPALPPRIDPPSEPTVERFSEPAQPEPAVATLPPLELDSEPTEDPFHVFSGDIPKLNRYQEIDQYAHDLHPEPESPLPFLQSVESSDTILLSDLPNRARIESERPIWNKVLFAVLSLVLGLALIGQVVYFLRNPIAGWLPDARPVFEQACRTLGCTMPLSQQLDLLKVESSSLETDPEQPTRAKLKVNFSNRSRQVQAWPVFVLRLSGLQGAAVAQRAFRPKDYLPKTKLESAGMAPMSEQEILLDLDLGGLSASGYEIKPQYP